jgi:phenylacetate-CoA ligase
VEGSIMEGRKYWNPRVETMPTDEIRQLQFERLRYQINRAYAISPLVRELWDNAGLTPGDIKSLKDFTKRVPTIDKEMVRQYRERTGDPFGGMSILPPEGRCWINSSSGTTGAPTFLPITDRDIETFAESYCRYFWACGVRPGDTILIAITMFLRGSRPLYIACEKMGLKAILTDMLDAPRIVHAIRYLKPKFMIYLTPPLQQGIRDELVLLGFDPPQTFASMKSLIFAGDKLTPKARRIINEEWGCEAFELSGTADLNYFFVECEFHDGLHGWDDMFFLEIVDPKTDQPVGPGERGEFIFTSLLDESLAFIRWRSEDIGYVSTEPCPCGRTHPRTYFLGRVGYEVSIKGKSLFPGEIHECLEAFPETDHGLFQIIKYAPMMDTLRLKIGLRPNQSGDHDAIKRKVGAGLAKRFALAVDMEFVPNAELLAIGPPHKIPRIDDRSK